MSEAKADNAKPRRFPPWLRKRIPAGGRGKRVRELLAELQLETVCNAAQCPNQCECFAKGTATFMILGSVCTRKCRFCAVAGGEPQHVAADEPARLAEAVEAMGLRHVVVTSVTRDDLPDGGSAHFAAVIHAIRAKSPQCSVEVLTPDFGGDENDIATVAVAGPTIYNHNVETVPRLYATVRPEADYRRSLGVLATVRRLAPEMLTKSGLMVGLGETDDELLAVLSDLREVDCQIVTIGQYLSPSREHLPVVEFIHPDIFARWKQRAESMGFLAVASGPFVRSSHNAEEVFELARRHACKPK